MLIHESETRMKKLFSILVILAIIGAVFAAEPIYDASLNVLMGTYGPGDTLTVYGFIDHTTGEGTLPKTSLTLRFYNSMSGPGLSTPITSINYVSDYENPNNLLLDGAFTATKSLSGLTTGDYYVEALINGQVEASAMFSYDSSLNRNSTLTVPSSYITAGNINVGYTISKVNTVEDVIYTVDFYTPTMDGQGTSKQTDTMTVTNTNSSSKLVSFTSAEFSDLANVLVVKVTGTNQTVQDLPQGFARVWLIGQPVSIESSGSMAFNYDNCKAKEGAERICSFTVTNTGDYPASFAVTASSELETSVSFDSSLLQPNTERTGTITLTGVEGDAPVKQLELNLKYGAQVLQSLNGSVTVETRDLLSQISILDFDITPTDIRPGDEVTVSFKVKNTGDFSERVRVQYVLGDEDPVNYGNTYNLLKNQIRSVSVTFNAPEEEVVPFSLNILKEDDVIAGTVTNIYIEPFVFTPFTRWKTEYKYLEQGDTDENVIKVRNDGNTAEYYQVTVESNYASLDKRVYLLAGQSTDITVPILISNTAEVGAFNVEAEVCSLTTYECDTDDFTITVLEKEKENTTIVLNQTLQDLSGDEGAVFEVAVQNFEGATKTYSVSVDAFNGEIQVSPSDLTIMNGEEGVFYLYAKPENKMTQDITYNVMSGKEVVSTGNLTLSYPGLGLTGLITLSEAGSLGAIILGIALIGALVFLGVRSFNQSKVELKYWK